MSYYEDFSKELNAEVDAWKKTDADIKEQIETQKGLVDKYKALIDADMEKGNATDETAKNSLNLQFAEKRLAKAEADLKEHEAKPLYTLDEYDKTCRRITNDYKAETYKERIKLQKKVDECLKILDNMDEYGHQASLCQGALKQACRECGENIQAEFKDSKFNTSLSMSVVPYVARDIKKPLKDIAYRLNRK